MAVDIQQVRELALTLPRTEELLVRDHITFRVGPVVYLGFSPDETVMGFAFPREERDLLIAAEPEKFLLPSKGDLRWNWVLVVLAQLEQEEMHDRVVEAWSMAVPRKVAAEHLGW